MIRYVEFDALKGKRWAKSRPLSTPWSSSMGINIVHMFKSHLAYSSVIY